jgi:hypothetical protein
MEPDNNNNKGKSQPTVNPMSCLSDWMSVRKSQQDRRERGNPADESRSSGRMTS